MTDITVVEAMKKKVMLENEIRDLCIKFISDTGLKITSLDVHGVETYGGEYFIVDVDVDVELQ